MLRKLLPILLILWAFLLLPTTAWADPIAVGGSYVSSGPIPTISYGLFGQGFSMNARASTIAGINNPSCAPPCPAGSSVNLSGSSFIGSSDFNFPSTVSVNGVTYDFLTTSFNAQFNLL